MSLFKVTGIQTVENKEVFAFAEKVLNTDKRISLHIEGAYISGTFRGKSNNEYEYCYASKSFVLESDAYEVEDAFTKVVEEEIEVVEEVAEETNSINSVLLIEEIQSLQRKSEITDAQAFDFERRSDHVISKQTPFFYKGVEVIRLQVSPFITIGHYLNRDNYQQTIIIEKLG